MRCYDCIALEVSHGHETGEIDERCLVGEPEFEFKDGSFGCHRRSVEKLERDIENANERMAKDMGAMADFVLNELQASAALAEKEPSNDETDDTTARG